MPTEYQTAYLKAAIAEMRTTLEDPESDPADHATGITPLVIINEAGDVVADMSFGDLPHVLPNMTRPKPGDDVPEIPLALSRPDPSRGDVLSQRALYHINPSLIQLRLRNHAHATLWLQDSATGAMLKQDLTPDEQNTVDEYATAIAFDMTGLANGELVNPAPDELAVIDDGPELVRHMLVAAEALQDFTTALAGRAQADFNQSEDDEYEPDDLLLMAQNLALLARGTYGAAQIFQSMFHTDPRPDRWTPKPGVFYYYEDDDLD